MTERRTRLMCFESIDAHQGLAIVAPVFRTPVTPFCSAYVAGMQHSPSAETSPRCNSGSWVRERAYCRRLHADVHAGCTVCMHGRRSLLPSQICDFASLNDGRFMALPWPLGDETMRLSEGLLVNGGGSGTPVAKRACIQYTTEREMLPSVCHRCEIVKRQMVY